MEVGVREDVQPNLLLETLKIMNKKGLVSQPVKMGRCKFTKKPFNIIMTKKMCRKKTAVLQFFIVLFHYYVHMGNVLRFNFIRTLLSILRQKCSA